ncbi:microcystin-dependent protein [Paenibacillus cellulosilyticus]|uniref:Microcystin-dependent protein n=1 Tax=Paenibacillus cellulosilyticus TaxID=375489 RepID=A0A2V2YU85_9BACL|nr:tail fiber protein [Paenibacillus cellulosilyticus]PWW00755.1 microcystin-dependent protein [Paenibacillus cellulosilyticus]QKS45610.1 phage tail protein [Paenibacillus cellulosilyticus]
MASSYIGEIRMFAGNFAPAGWMLCQGQSLAISEYEALYVLIGTTYGGDGVSTFALPNLSGRAPIHMGTNASGGSTYVLGQNGGTEQVTLTTNQIPAHTHTVLGQSAQGNTSNPKDASLASSSLSFYTEGNAAVKGQMMAGAIEPIGSSQPHNNMMPFLSINFIISLYGIFPTQS